MELYISFFLISNIMRPFLNRMCPFQILNHALNGITHPVWDLKKTTLSPKSWFSLVLTTFYQCNLMKTHTKPALPKSIKPLNDSKGIYNTLILCCHLAVICIFAATFLKASISFPSSLLWVVRFNYLVIISQRACFLEKIYVIGDWFHVKGEMDSL